MKDPIFKGFVSNTPGAFCAQNAFFPDDPEKTCTGRVWYKLYAGGEYPYRLYFGNTVDSTFGEGEFCHPNEVCDSWRIACARVAVCPPETDIDHADLKNADYLTFNGQPAKTVMPGEIFGSDEIVLKAEKGDYLCLEITFRGAKIPYLAEAHATVPTFVKTPEGWEKNVKVPGAFLVACKRKVRKHIAFLGDSITMGCGTPQNQYLYWAARIGEMVGEDYAWWNLGIGYARCSDAATDGTWLYKAKQADLVNVALGTNDLLRKADPDKVVNDLHLIVDKLKAAGCEVGMFTIPPFGYTGEDVADWDRANQRIRTEFADKCLYVFDTCPSLDSPAPNHGIGKYNAHPNAEGCGILAKDFVAFAKERNLF